MNVVGITSSQREVANFDRIYARAELPLAVKEVDYLVILTPYSADTRNIVDAKILGAMKRSAYLINLARGGVVHEEALIQALQDQEIAGAALDVFNQEPLPEGHPFWSLTNLIVMPHLAGFNDEYAGYALPVIEKNLQRYLAGDFSNMLNVIKGHDFSIGAGQVRH
jgi:D-2-hydroxyacid dehydrogenase (NADP+)